jgi:uncharacterized repeat protein (TIGR03803 family)
MTADGQPVVGETSNKVLVMSAVGAMQAAGHKSHGIGSIVPALAKNARAGHPHSQNGKRCETQRVGHPPNPVGPLMQAADGNFYGTTSSGGSAGNYGTIFKLDQSESVSILHDFNYNDGANPVAGLIQGTDGKLYGTAPYGGTNNAGTLFQLGTPGSFATLYHFGPRGETPLASLMQDTNGTFYGTTYAGGRDGYGIVYSLNMGLGPFVAFVQATGKVGGSVQVLGQDLTGTTTVTFNGVPATSFSVKTDTYMTAIVPAGATTGPVVVTTPTGTLTSNVSFRISQ